MSRVLDRLKVGLFDKCCLSGPVVVCFGFQDIFRVSTDSCFCQTCNVLLDSHMKCNLGLFLKPKSCNLYFCLFSGHEIAYEVMQSPGDMVMLLPIPVLATSP